MGGLTDAELAAAAGNTLLPLLIAIIMRPTWSEKTRALVALGVTLTINVLVRLALTAATDLPHDWQAWLRFLLMCAVVSAVSYVALWRETGLTQRVEAATSPKRTRREIVAVMDLREEAARKASPPPTDTD